LTHHALPDYRNFLPRDAAALNGENGRPCYASHDRCANGSFLLSLGFTVTYGCGKLAQILWKFGAKHRTFLIGIAETPVPQANERRNTVEKSVEGLWITRNRSDPKSSFSLF
jgi:hypothetical protein